MKKHKHHIIPRYRCKELGIDPDFDENIVEVDRLDHARIHWGYKCDDLEPLFEYITPAQWIIDLIPRGDNRDSGGAAIIALGEIDGVDNIGKNHPMYGIPRSEETKKKLSIAHKGKTLTEETKEKLRIVRQNQLNDEEYLKKYRKGVKEAGLLRRGVKQGPMSEESKKKMIETKKRKHENGEYDYSWVKSGEEAGGYKDGRAVNARNDPEVMRAYKSQWYQNNKKKKAEKQGVGTWGDFFE